MLLFPWLACQSPSVTEGNHEEMPAEINQEECYLYSEKGDTARLQILTSEGIVTGKLNYEWAEKDQNKGFIRGELKGDTLIADYIFQSEGIESTREVVFLRKGNTFKEGNGPISFKNNRWSFNDRSSLQFEEGMTFHLTDCR